MKMYDFSFWKITYNKTLILLPKTRFFRTFSCTATCIVDTLLHPYVVVRRQESPQPNPVFLLHLHDLRGAIIVAGRKNFATEVKQSLEAEIKKRTREDGKRETGKRRDIETGGCPGFDRNKGDHHPPRHRTLLPRGVPLFYCLNKAHN